MCGFSAIFAYHPDAENVDNKELMAINQAMVRRGPDGDGCWLSGDQRVGLAHRRLAIIDIGVTGHQPMCVKRLDGSGHDLWVTYNGEIYNFKELKQDLESDGVVFKSQSDTEVILRLYERHGLGMVKKLRGMFALALWDEASAGMLLARDPLGIKPLYYADDGKTVRAASQVKALLAGKNINTTPEPAGHVGFFLTGAVPDPFTMVKGIRSLPAGHMLWIERGGARRQQQFWKMFGPGDEVIAPDGLREQLLDSVRHHLVADVPVGVFLSSGLDSATLCALASELLDKPLETVTLGFDEFSGTALDETVLAGKIAGHYGTKHTEARISKSDFDDAREDILKAMDQPSIDGVNTYFVARAAAIQGLKVVLSGLGGDELFAGYNTFDDVPKLVKNLGRIPGIGCMGRAFRAVAAPFCKHRISPKYAGLFEFGGTYEGAYLLRRGLYMPWELPHLMDPEMAALGWRELSPLMMMKDLHRPVATPVAKIAALETACYMKNQLLRDADWAGMAHSLEIRVPLVDAHLFKAISPVALDQLWTGFSKQMMAGCAQKALPEAVLSRPKSGFFTPVQDWLEKSSGGDVNERGLRGWARQVYKTYSV